MTSLCAMRHFQCVKCGRKRSVDVGETSKTKCSLANEKCKQFDGIEKTIDISTDRNRVSERGTVSPNTRRESLVIKPHRKIQVNFPEIKTNNSEKQNGGYKEDDRHAKRRERRKSSGKHKSEKTSEESSSIVCSRCSNKFTEMEKRLNAEIEVLRVELQETKRQHATKVKGQKRSPAESQSEDKDSDGRKSDTISPREEMGLLRQESQLYRRHSTLNDLEDKLLDRIQTITSRQEAIELAEQDIIEEEGRIERRQSILVERQLLTQNMHKEDCEDTIMDSGVLAEKSQRAQSNWDLVRSAFQDQHSVIQQSLNNCKVQLAVSQNKEIELRKEINILKEKLKESEQSSIQKDRKVKDLQERLTIAIKQSMTSSHQNRKQTITVDELPNRIQNENDSNRFVYFSKQRNSNSSGKVN